jgi:hypothetical protein
LQGHDELTESNGSRLTLLLLHFSTGGRDLHDMGLTGSIPSAISALTELELL